MKQNKQKQEGISKELKKASLIMISTVLFCAFLITGAVRYLYYTDYITHEFIANNEFLCTLLANELTEDVVLQDERYERLMQFNPHVRRAAVYIKNHDTAEIAYEYWEKNGEDVPGSQPQYKALLDQIHEMADYMLSDPYDGDDITYVTEGSIYAIMTRTVADQENKARVMVIEADFTQARDGIRRVTLSSFLIYLLAAAFSIVIFSWLFDGVIARFYENLCNQLVNIKLEDYREKHHKKHIFKQREDMFIDLAAREKRKAYIDHLTQLYNRRYFDDIAFKRLSKTGEKYAFILLDIDDFKSVNDTYGHQEGDRVLREVSDEISSTVRKNDMVIRWGGDEILIVMHCEDKADRVSGAEHLIQRIMSKKIRIDPTKPQSEENLLKMTMGCVQYPLYDKYPEILDIYQYIELADKCMYYGKKRGKNKFVSLDIVREPKENEAESLARTPTYGFECGLFNVTI